jgi:hypothetical protein
MAGLEDEDDDEEEEDDEEDGDRVTDAASTLTLTSSSGSFIKHLDLLIRDKVGSHTMESELFLILACKYVYLQHVILAYLLL